MESSKNWKQSTFSLDKELKQYFKGKLKDFTVPVEFSGTDFQKRCGKNFRISISENTEATNLKQTL
jgi:O6-methylguanine-DNA--protein-cysteine methyltransferase